MTSTLTRSCPEVVAGRGPRSWFAAAYSCPSPPAESHTGSKMPTRSVRPCAQEIPGGGDPLTVLVAWVADATRLMSRQRSAERFKVSNQARNGNLVGPGCSRADRQYTTAMLANVDYLLSTRSWESCAPSEEAESFAKSNRNRTIVARHKGRALHCVLYSGISIIYCNIIRLVYRIRPFRLSQTE